MVVSSHEEQQTNIKVQKCVVILPKIVKNWNQSPKEYCEHFVDQVIASVSVE